MRRNLKGVSFLGSKSRFSAPLVNTSILFWKVYNVHKVLCREIGPTAIVVVVMCILGGLFVVVVACGQKRIFCRVY